MENAQHEQNEPNRLRKGLSVPQVVIFVVASVCGSGVPALPKALVDSGWFGIAVMILCGITATYTGSILGRCWVVIKQRYHEYDDKHIADPLPTIGFRAAGKWGEFGARFCILFSLFGVGVVYLLLIAENTENLITNLGNVSFHTCYLIPIVGAVLLPLSWLGTPKDFWLAGIVAAATISVAALLIVVGLVVMFSSQPRLVTHARPSFEGFFTAFGKFIFACGGVYVFPTFQVDMKDPTKFTLAVTIGMTCAVAIYLPVSIAGFVVLGDYMVYANILKNMTPNWILYTVIILINFHFLLGFIIVVNPLLQDLEAILKIENKFSLKRVLVRTFIMILFVVVALAVPHFEIILNLFGGTIIAAINFIFPLLFYLLLSRQKSRKDGYQTVEDRTSENERARLLSNEYSDNFGHKMSTDNDERWVNFEVSFCAKMTFIVIIVIGIIGGIASVYSAIKSLVNGSSRFTAACFWNWAVADTANKVT